MRIDKWLANKAYGSRKEVHELIKKNQVTVNGILCKAKDFSINPDVDTISVRGEMVSKKRLYYIKFHKPCGYVTAVADSQPTVMDLLPAEFKKMGVFPVGRLDKDTSGLLLLTNDGQWGHRIINGTKNIDKTYVASLTAPLELEATAKAKAGIVLKDGTICKPATLIEEDALHIRLIIQEGKYHQVRRMVAALGSRVLTLCRVSIDSLDLTDIPNEGEYRYLLPEEVEKF